jgi:hypothetical protein
VINGHASHSEICLMCDLTLCAEEAMIFDPHFTMGSVPGDGIHSCLQELLGVKRAAYALLTGQRIDARTALEWGMVNEVLPRDQLLGRAWKLADHIMSQPRVTRRLTTQIIRRPWKRRITDDLDGGFGIQMFAHLAKNQAIHDAEHAGAAAAATRMKVRRWRASSVTPPGTQLEPDHGRRCPRDLFPAGAEVRARRKPHLGLGAGEGCRGLAIDGDCAGWRRRERAGRTGLMAQLATPDAVKLLQAFAAIESGDVRRALVTVAQR